MDQNSCIVLCIIGISTDMGAPINQQDLFISLSSHSFRKN